MPGNCVGDIWTERPQGRAPHSYRVITIEPGLPLLMDAATIPPVCGRYASFLPAEAMADSQIGA